MTTVSSPHKIIWITGVSGGGKTTLGCALAKRFHCVHFDGDVWGHDGDATGNSGWVDPELKQQSSAESQQRWADLVAVFVKLFHGNETSVDEWRPFFKPMCDAIAAVDTQGRPLVVTFSVYPLIVRDLIREFLPTVEFVALHDPTGLAVQRKAKQVAAAAEKAGKTLLAYLHSFSADEWPLDLTDQQVWDKLISQQETYHRGYEPGDDCIDVTDKDAEAVLQLVAKRFALKE